MKQVLRANRAIVAACEAMDGDGILRATEEREQALLRLKESTADPTRFTAELAGATLDATQALQAMQKKIRESLLQVAKGVRAAKGYASGNQEASALDRSS